MSGKRFRGGTQTSRNAFKLWILENRYNVNLLCFRYRALYPYRPKETDELDLEADDIIFVVEKCDDGWFIGKIGVIEIRLTGLSLQVLLYEQLSLALFLETT